MLLQIEVHDYRTRTAVRDLACFFRYCRAVSDESMDVKGDRIVEIEDLKKNGWTTAK